MIIPSFNGETQKYARAWALVVFKAYEEQHARATEILEKLQPGIRKLLVKAIAYNALAWRRVKRLVLLAEDAGIEAADWPSTIRTLNKSIRILEEIYSATGFETLTADFPDATLEEPLKEGPIPGRYARTGIGLPPVPPPAGLGGDHESDS